MHFDDLLVSYLGEFGKYQRIQFFLVCLPCVLVSLQVMSWTFTGADLPFRCKYSEENETWPFNLNDTHLAVTPLGPEYCQFGTANPNARDCPSGLTYDHSEISQTATSRWEIACSIKWIKPLIQASYYIGQVVGSLFFGWVGDRYGRKICLIISLILMTAAGITMAFVPHWSLFFILRMVMGVCHPGVFVVANIVGSELVGPSHRMMAGIMTGAFFAVGQILLALLAFLIRDYQWLQFTISAPAVLFLCYWWIVPESPRWLYSQRRYPDADKILRKGAEMNGKELPLEWWKLLDTPAASKKDDGVAKKFGYGDLLKTPRIRKRMLICWFCWPAVSMVYYGLGMNPSFLGGDRYATFALSGLIEVPGIIIAAFTVNRVGRKILHIGGFGLCGLLLLLTLAIPQDPNNPGNLDPAYKPATVALVIISKGAITMVYALMYIFTPELFPTQLRSLAMGTCSMAARIGAVSASYIAMYLNDYSRVATVMIYTCMALVASILMFFQPETTGTSLVETVEESEAFGSDVGPFDFRPWLKAKPKVVETEDVQAASGEELKELVSPGEKKV